MKSKQILYSAIVILVSVLLLIFLTPVVNALAVTFSTDVLLGFNRAEWIGFYGNLLGGILSAFITVIVLVLTLRHAFNNERRDRMPYLTLKKTINRTTDNDGKIIETILIVFSNIGSNSAVNITCDKSLSIWDELDENDRNKLPPLAVDASYEYMVEHVMLNIGDDDTRVFNFEFEDIMGVKYRQNITLQKDGYVINNSSPERI